MITLGPEAAPDFSDPLGLIKACHQRILKHCEILEKLVAHIAAHGVDAEATTAIARVRRYFSSAGIHHHMDEEQDVFPLLEQSSSKMADIIHDLKQEHEAIHQQWVELATLLASPQSLADAESFPALVEQFCELQRNHIQVEERDLFSHAGQVLTSEQLKIIGRNMQQRRKPAEDEASALQPS